MRCASRTIALFTAVPALLVTAGAARASTTTTSSAPLTVTSAARVVADHHLVTLTAHLTTGKAVAAGHSVALFARAAGAGRFTKIASAETNSSGNAVFTFTIEHNEQFKAVHAADQTTKASTSSVAGVYDRPRLAVTGPSAPVMAGSMQTLKVQGSPVIDSEVVTLEVKGTNGFSVLAKGRLSRAGTISFTVRPAKTHTYFIHIGNTVRHLPASSKSVTVTAG